MTLSSSNTAGASASGSPGGAPDLLEHQRPPQDLPPLVDRDAMLRTLTTEVFGEAPELVAPVSCTTIESQTGWLAGKADHHRLELAVPTAHGPFLLPFTLTVSSPSAPTVLLLNFGRLPHEYCPVEELIDGGVNVCVLDYRDVTSDDADFSSGLAGSLPRTGPHPWGKIALWAWACCRVMDHLVTRDDLDPAKVWIAGHSRLGKTALWAGALDQRFRGAISNNSGCAGAALARGNVGETIRDITDIFGYWFTPAYSTWAGREDELPWDQHWLLAAIAPRLVCVGSAADDAWADPVAEHLAGLAAAPAWPPTTATAGEFPVQHHLRPGGHFLSRDDWRHYLAAMTSGHTAGEDTSSDVPPPQ